MSIVPSEVPAYTPNMGRAVSGDFAFVVVLLSLSANHKNRTCSLASPRTCRQRRCSYVRLISEEHVVNGRYFFALGHGAGGVKATGLGRREAAD